MGWGIVSILFYSSILCFYEIKPWSEALLQGVKLGDYTDHVSRICNGGSARQHKVKHVVHNITRQPSFVGQLLLLLELQPLPSDIAPRRKELRSFARR